jgi:CysZ protein
MPILGAVGRALRDVGKPRVLAVLFLPMLGAIVLWTVLAWAFWDIWTVALRNLFDGTAVARWFTEHGASWVLGSFSAFVVVALLLPLILITAIVLTELVAMPVIVSVVSREYPVLEKRSGGSVAGSMLNAAAAITFFILLWIVTLPLWLTGFGAFILPALNSAYLNQRLFRYDALAEHASPDEYRALVTRAKGRLYLLGLLLAGLYYLPFVNLVAPVVSGLAFTHFCLDELARYRRQAVIRDS